jgi:hypothetical protein
MKTAEILKSIYNELPWPNHVELCRDRFDEALAAMPGTSSSVLGSFGLRVEVNEDMPPDEIHLVFRREGKFLVERVIKIEDKSPIFGIYPHSATT